MKKLSLTKNPMIQLSQRLHQKVVQPRNKIIKQKTRKIKLKLHQWNKAFKNRTLKVSEN